MQYDTCNAALPGCQVQGGPRAQALPIQDDVLPLDASLEEPLEGRVDVGYGIRDGGASLALAVARVVVRAQVALQVLGNLAAEAQRKFQTGSAMHNTQDSCWLHHIQQAFCRAACSWHCWTKHLRPILYLHGTLVSLTGAVKTLLCTG